MSETTPAAWQWLDTATFRKSVPASSNPSEWTPLYACPAPDVQELVEPVALLNIYPDGYREFHNGKDNDADCAVPVYLHPPANDVAELVEVLKALIPCVAIQAIGCHGYKCREPWCWSCNGEEDADKVAYSNLLALDAAVKVLAKWQGE